MRRRKRQSAGALQRYASLKLLHLERVAFNEDWTVEPGSTQFRKSSRAGVGPEGRQRRGATHRGTGYLTGTEGDVTMEPEARSGRMDAVQARPLAELLECPPATANLLNGSARCNDFDAGSIVFRQFAPCMGLYLVISGQFLRKTERLETRLTLGSTRAGDLVELAAALGVGQHTYTLTAQTPGSVLMLPIETLNFAFQDYPSLRMRLLEELAREVSRAYGATCLSRTTRTRLGSVADSMA